MENNGIETLQDKLKSSNEVDMENFYESSSKTYDTFEEQSHLKGKGYRCPNYPMFNKYIEGLEEGLYIFAGESNSGKTAAATNLLWDYCLYKSNKLFGIYYSLDDSTSEVVPRLIAMNEMIPISVGKKPVFYLDKIKELEMSKDNADIETRRKYIEYMEKRESGLINLKAAAENFMIVDRDKITCLEELIDHAKKVQLFVKSFDPENNIIIGIDSLADLTVTEQKFSSDKDQISYLSKRVKALANNELKVPIFASYHLRKLNHNGRPTVDDIKESGRLVYEASCVFLVFNDVSKNKQGANIYYTDIESQEKLPIIEFDWAKNKKSSFKGRTYHYFVPDCSKITECGKEERTRFDSIIYTK